jgi:formylglycine-generating enzyme required for sulfatase activity
LGLVLLLGAGLADATGGRALVIGNAKYENERPLANTINDAQDVAAKLRDIGYTVVPLTNLPGRQLLREVNRFLESIRDTADWAVIYYSGHGIQDSYRNSYLLPVDAKIEGEADVKSEGISVNAILEELAARPDAAVSLVVLDACRNNPYATTRGGKGLGRVTTNGGTLVLYAASPNQTADDNPRGRNGLFTQHLLGLLDRPGLDIEDAFDEVALQVKSGSGGTQVPYKEGNLLGKHYLAGPAALPPHEPVAQPLPTPTPRPPPRPSQVASPAPVTAGTWTEPQTGMDFVRVPPGRFQMGCGGAWAGECLDDEKPARQVQVKGYWLATTEVTQAQWQAVMGSNPSNFKDCDDCPVEQVSWNDAQAFIAKLDPGGQQGLRLPTEAEWEYACRGGGKEETYCGGKDLDRLAWYDQNSRSKTHPVGGKTANGLGLYDMSGNVWEWTCSDYVDPYDGAEQRCLSNNDATSARVVRGGSWSGLSREARAAVRFNCFDPGVRLVYLGLRLARTLSP